MERIRNAGTLCSPIAIGVNLNQPSESEVQLVTELLD
jgi:hypothetical protein